MRKKPIEFLKIDPEVEKNRSPGSKRSREPGTSPG